MPSVSNFKLCLLDHSRDLWDGAFEAQIAHLEAHPDDHTALGVLADWLVEFEEPELAVAARYCHKRREDLTFKAPTDKQYGSWRIEGIPYNVDRISTVGHHGRTLAAALADLALKLAEARKELE